MAQWHVSYFYTRENPILLVKSDSGMGLAFASTAVISTDEAPCYLAILFMEMANGMILTRPTKVIWSENRDNPVGRNTTLVFSASQSLVLYETEGTTTSHVWSAKMKQNLVSAMSMSEKGNLVILDRNRVVIWQSFDYFTDTLLEGQIFWEGQCLTLSVSSSNMSRGLFYLSVNLTSITAYSEADNLASLTKYLSIVWFSYSRTHLNSEEFTKENITLPYLICCYLSYKHLVLNSTGVEILKLDYDGGPRIYGGEPGKD
ncbi:Bulb-type lectin domain containing protein [Trema orientale]|uniref:Bulb-type lectin domain containing protein n=1 Tax=Trema orientale TaxID=63057 RepID=A0A2P5FDL7_TREOI|nr:Bulb-type lectin domain containing protein [Trema orientale]